MLQIPAALWNPSTFVDETRGYTVHKERTLGLQQLLHIFAVLLAIPLDFVVDGAYCAQQRLAVVSRQNFEGGNDLTARVSGHNGLEQPVERDRGAQHVQ